MLLITASTTEMGDSNYLAEAFYSPKKETLRPIFLVIFYRCLLVVQP